MTAEVSHLESSIGIISTDAAGDGGPSRTKVDPSKAASRSMI